MPQGAHAPFPGNMGKARRSQRRRARRGSRSPSRRRGQRVARSEPRCTTWTAQLVRHDVADGGGRRTPFSGACIIGFGAIRCCLPRVNVSPTNQFTIRITQVYSRTACSPEPRQAERAILLTRTAHGCSTSGGWEISRVVGGLLWKQREGQWGPET